MITPVGKNIYLKMAEVKKVGDLVTDAKKSIHESAEVLAIGPDVTIKVKVGDTVLVKGYGIDSVTYNKEELFFVSEDSGAILAVISLQYGKRPHREVTY